MRLFGMARYARTPLRTQLLGRPLRVRVNADHEFEVVPCGHMKWICACVRDKYKDDPRHEEYESVWVEMTSAGSKAVRSQGLGSSPQS